MMPMGMNGLVATPQQQEQQKQLEQQLLQRRMLAQALRGGGQGMDFSQMLGGQGGAQQAALMRSLASLGGF